MSPITTESRTVYKSPPDLSFPPKFTNDSSIDEIINTNPPKNPLQFGFPIIRQPTPTPKRMPEIMTTFTPLDSVLPAKQEPPFLRIPLEIRLQIYGYVLASHPIFHAHLAPPPEPSTCSSSNTKTEEFHTTMFRPQGQSNPTTSVLTTTAPAQSHSISALYPISPPSPVISRAKSPNQVRGKIPTGLLASCRQVYEETRTLPWETNTHSFINWFWSGVYAARQFTRALRPWQSESMRWVGVEVLGRDLCGGLSTSGMLSKWDVVIKDGEEGDKATSEWVELCSLWEDVWGLRLGIKGSCKLKSGGAGDWVEEGGIWVRPKEIAIMMERKKKEGGKRSMLDVEREWVSEGLRRMKKLRWIELEIEDEDVGREEKLNFCGQLEEKLNEGRQEGDARCRVVFVERIKKEELKNKDFTWYGGEPGDDSIWGLDM